MLHQIDQPKCYDALLGLVAFQRRVLEFADSAHSGPPLSDAGFNAVFDAKQAAWLWARAWYQGKETKFHERLTTLVTHLRSHPNTGPQLLAAFDADVDHSQRFGDGAYVFAFRTLPTDLQAAAKPLLMHFYSGLLERGIPEYIHGARGFGELTRAGVRECLYEASKDLKVCSACDAKRPDRGTFKDSAENEHFFPEAEYPCLSVHPGNLYRACKECNQTYKATQDPLETVDHVPGTLLNTFHPYSVPGGEHIVVTVCARSGVLDVTISEKDEQPSRRLANLLRLYDLAGRWTNRLNDYVSETIESEIIATREHGATSWTERELRECIKRLAEKRTKKKGRQLDAIVAASYLEYLHGSPTLSSYLAKVNTP